MCSYSGYWAEDTCGQIYLRDKDLFEQYLICKLFIYLFIYLLICSFVCMYFLHLFVYLFN